MHVKSIVSAIALSAALALSGPAFAQTMFNGVELSAEDLPAVTERCEQLVTAASTESETETTSDEPAAADSTETTAATTEATTDVPAVNEVEAATTTSIDLDTITLEQCTAAGLGGAM